MKNLKVLIVEDEVDVRRMLCEFIRKQGFDCLETEDAQVAKEMLSAEKPDIIIADLKIPHGDGFQVIRQAKKLLPFMQWILITAFGNPDTAITALREGAVDYLIKPIDLKALELALGMARDKVIEQQKNIPYPVILIAEDDEAARKILGRSLQKENWEILLAQDGEEAINIFQKRKVDLVILDIKMPKKGGLDTLHQMNQLSDDFVAIMVTGYGDEESVMKALKDGAINFLRKPVDLGELELFMDKALAELMMKRALKYRKRELELAQNAINRIVTLGGTTIGFPVDNKTLSRDTLIKLLDSLPIGLILISSNREICYVNKLFAWTIQEGVDKIDQSFMNKLAKVGIHNLSSEILMSALDNMFTQQNGAIETIKAGQWAYIVLVKLRMLRNEKVDDLILLVIRGERA